MNRSVFGLLRLLRVADPRSAASHPMSETIVLLICQNRHTLSQRENIVCKVAGAARELAERSLPETWPYSVGSGARNSGTRTAWQGSFAHLSRIAD